MSTRCTTPIGPVRGSSHPSTAIPASNASAPIAWRLDEGRGRERDIIGLELYPAFPLAGERLAATFGGMGDADNSIPLGDRMREWCAGRWWHWRLPLLLLLLVQATRPLRTQGEPHLFAGITFGAHEFGHLFFAFGGEWLTIAGGSLMQLLIPIGAAAVVARSKDWFGVAVCGLFLAASLGDLSWYIADARARELDLLSFSPDASGHDWAYLLSRAGMLRHDLRLARFTRFVGWILVFASSLLAMRLLYWMKTEPVRGERDEG